MVAVIFKTPTLLDIRAITTFGLHAKPNSKSPIGYFGTGLKMAIAVLVRNNIRVKIYIGHREYEFYTKQEDFRNTKFNGIRMRQRSFLKGWSYERLPFTTGLAKNWELWMAYRELESNTIDEGGFTSLRDGSVADVDSDSTCIIVEGDAFYDIARRRDEVFLSNAIREPTIGTPAFQVFDQPSKYIFYRGMRVMELEKPSLMTYNILSQQVLTEDRTLKDQWYLPYQLVRFLVQSNDLQLIRRYLDVTDKNWEYDLPLDTAEAPSDAFLATIKKRHAEQAKEHQRLAGEEPRHLSYSPRFTSYYSAHAAPKSPSYKERYRTWFEQYTNGDTNSGEDMAMLKEVYDAFEPGSDF